MLLNQIFKNSSYDDTQFSDIEKEAILVALYFSSSKILIVSLIWKHTLTLVDWEASKEDNAKLFTKM